MYKGIKLSSNEEKRHLLALMKASEGICYKKKPRTIQKWNENIIQQINGGKHLVIWKDSMKKSGKMCNTIWCTSFLKLSPTKFIKTLA